MRVQHVAALSILALTLVACAATPEVSQTTLSITTTTKAPPPTTSLSSPPMDLTSPAFTDNGVVPTKFTCDGMDISPELSIRFLPQGTVALAVIVDDPDAPVGTWDHWVEYDIETDGTDQIWPEGVDTLGTAGFNSWKLTGYGGPCPPSGQNHRYFFTVFALDASLGLPAEVDSETVRLAMDGHILGEAQLIGTYSR